MQRHQGNPIVGDYSVLNGTGIVGSTLGLGMDWYFLIQLFATGGCGWSKVELCWKAIGQVDGRKIPWGCSIQRCRYTVEAFSWGTWEVCEL